MKKYLLLVVIVLGFSTVAFAEQTASLSEVLTWRYGYCFGTSQENPNDMSPNPKMKISDWSCREQKPDEATIESLTIEYLASQDYWVKRFNSKILLGSVYQALEPASTLKLAPYTGALQSMMDWNNFEGIKDLIDGLVVQETMTADEKTIIYQCFLDQGIDLTLW